MSEQCYLLDLERTIKTGVATYWKPRKFGYTTNIYEAGLYSEDQAEAIAEDDIEDRTVIINQGIVKGL